MSDITIKKTMAGIKREPSTPSYTPQKSKAQKQISQQEDRCCNCTQRSTCSLSRRCACKAAGKACLNCMCFKVCANRDRKASKAAPTAAVSTDIVTQEVTPKKLSFDAPTKDDINDDETGDSTKIKFIQGTTEQNELPIGDLPGYDITAVDRKLMEVYGDYVHQNDGAHLDGGVMDDDVWQKRWKSLASLPRIHYHIPSGKVGRRYVTMLSTELEGIVSRKWNSERFIVFQMVVLQKSKLVKTAADIKRCVTTRMDNLVK